MISYRGVTPGKGAAGELIAVPISKANWAATPDRKITRVSGAIVDREAAQDYQAGDEWRFRLTRESSATAGGSELS